jgi:hypothetical protein
MADTTTKLTLQLPPDLHTRLKVFAASAGRTMRAVAIEALEKLLAKAERKANGGGK